MENDGREREKRRETLARTRVGGENINAIKRK
jgi:hypothetical protein